MPSGSNPFIGSSRINIFGSFNKHNPIPNLCLIPNEKFLTNFFSTLFNPTRLSISLMRSSLIDIPKYPAAYFKLS